MGKKVYGAKGKNGGKHAAEVGARAVRELVLRYTLWY